MTYVTWGGVPLNGKTIVYLKARNAAVGKEQ